MVVKQGMVFICLMLLLLLGWSVTLTSHPRQIQRQAELVCRSEEYLKDEIFLKAIDALEDASVLQTEHTESIMLQLAQLHLQIGDTFAYQEVMEKLIKNNSQNGDVYYHLASFYYKNSHYEQAIKTLRSGIEKLNSERLKEFYEQIRYKTYRLYCQFDDVKDFSNGMAAVKHDQKWGYINCNGKLVIGCKLDKASNFANNIALVEVKGRAAFIGPQGINDMVAEYTVEDIQSIAEGRAAVKINGYWHYIDMEFNKTSTGWEEVSCFNDGLAVVKDANKWRVRNLLNNTILELECSEILIDKITGRFMTEGVFFVQIAQQYYLFNLDGNKIGDHCWDNAKPFREEGGYAAVAASGKWGFINKYGQEILPCIWDEAHSFSNGLAAVKINEKWGFINIKGDLVIGTIYEDVHSFSEGLAAVKQNDSWCYIGLEEHRLLSKNNGLTKRWG